MGKTYYHLPPVKSLTHEMTRSRNSILLNPISIYF